MVRSSLVAACLALGACAPASPPAQPAQAPAPATAAPSDDPLRAGLARLPEAGPLSQALRQASREELAAALASLTPAQRADSRTIPVEQGAGAMLRASLDANDEDALAALCCGGRAVRSLASLRGRGSRDDVASTAHDVSHWAARALGHRIATHTSLDARDLDRAAVLAHVLDEAGLRAASRARLAMLEPSPLHVTNAAAASARALDVADARRWIEAARRVDASAIDPQLVPALERLTAVAEQLVKLGGAEAREGDSLPAAVLATRLDRLSLAGALLARSKVAPESDLRAAVVSVAVQGEGSLCQGLERSREPAEVCPLAWRTDPSYRSLTALLDRGLASGRGREPWAIEAYVGLGHVIPMLYETLGGALTPEQFLARVDEHFDAIRRGLDLQELDEVTRSSLALYASAQRLVFQQAVRAEPRPSIVDEASGKTLISQANSLLDRAPSDPLAGQVAMAVAMIVPRSPAASALLGRVPPGGPSGSTRAALAMVIGSREQVEQALPALQSPPAWLPTDARARDMLLAAEAQMDRGPGLSPGSLDGAATAQPSSEFGPVEALRRRLDHGAAMARAGVREEAETTLVETIEQVPAASLRDPVARDLLRLAETEAAQLLATRPDEASQRAGVARLRDHLSAPAGREDASPTVRLHRAMVLRSLLDHGRSFCEARERGCAADTKALKEQVRHQIATLEPLVASDDVARLQRGVVLVGDAPQLSLEFSVSQGLTVLPTYVPRLVVALPLDLGFMPPSKDHRPRRPPL